MAEEGPQVLGLELRDVGKDEDLEPGRIGNGPEIP